MSTKQNAKMKSSNKEIVSQTNANNTQTKKKKSKLPVKMNCELIIIKYEKYIQEYST